MSGLPVRRTLVICESYGRVAEAMAGTAIDAMPGINNGVCLGTRWRHADAACDTGLVSCRRHSEAPSRCHVDAPEDTKLVSFRRPPPRHQAGVKPASPRKWTSTGDVHWTSTVTSTVTSN